MIGIVSQARMTSTRLPGKVLLTVRGKTLLDYHIDRLNRSGMPIFIATTVNKTDDVIADFCEKRKIPYYRGSEHDVLSRYFGLATEFKLSKIVRVTSDCPLIDGELIRDSYKQYKDHFHWNSYLCNTQKRTYPRGFDFEIFSYQALQLMQTDAQQEYEREHVTPYIWKSHPEIFELIHVVRDENASKYRMTVDEPEDFTLIKTLIEKYDADSMNAEEIISLFHNDPQLIQINSHVEQKKI
jgi:spore coat polysaccharide biosynthesis protein SpsF